MWRFNLFFLLVLIPLAGVVTRAADPQLANGFVENSVLVQGKVIDLREATNGNVSFTIEVVHVFYGARDFVGAKFDGWSWRTPPAISVSGPRFIFDPPPKRDEIGIWWAGIHRTNHNEWSLHPVASRSFATRVPTRKDHGPRYEVALEWATAVERVSSAPRDEQFDILCKYARSETYETSYWAITVLAQEWGEKADEILGELVRYEKLPAVSVTALDAGLERLRGERWQNSPGRWEFLEQSLRSVATEFEARMVLEFWSKLVRDLKRQQLTPEQGLDIVKRAIQDPKCPDRIRNSLFVDVLRSFFIRSEDDEPIWIFAIENISQPVNSHIAVNAAFMLMDTRHRTPRRFRTLLKLSRETNHDNVAGQLRSVIGKWYEDAVDETSPQ